MLWGIGFVLMLPGTLILNASVEHLLWGTPVGLRAIALASVLSAVAVNALLFGAIMWASRWWRRRRSSS